MPNPNMATAWSGLTSGKNFRHTVATAWSGLTSGKNFRHTVLTQAFAHQNHLESMLHQHVYKTIQSDQEHAQNKELIGLQHRDNRAQRRHEFQTTQAQHEHEINTQKLGYEEAEKVRQHEVGQAAASRSHELDLGRQHSDQFADHIKNIVEQAKGDTDITVTHGDSSATFTRKLRTGGTKKTP